MFGTITITIKFTRYVCCVKKYLIYACNIGSYCIYDGIVYPHDSAKQRNVLEFLFNNFLLPFENQQRIALKIYVKGVILILCNDSLLLGHYGKRLKDVSENILEIYWQLSEKEFVYKNVALKKKTSLMKVRLRF